LFFQQILLGFTEKRSIEKVKKKHACHYSRSENISAILVPFAYARVPLFGHFRAPLCAKKSPGWQKSLKSIGFIDKAGFGVMKWQKRLKRKCFKKENPKKSTR